MSLPVERFFCDSCNYESSNTVIWGHFLYILENNGEDIYENINRTYGWCYECDRICPIEDLFSIDELVKEKKQRIERYNEYKQNLKKRENKLIKFPSTKELIERLKETINKYENEKLIGIELLINAMKDRSSDPKCLFCSSEEIIPLDIPMLESLNQFNPKETKDVKNINFQHSGCGGNLKIENLTLRLAIINPKRVYDIDGYLLQDSEGSKDIGRDSFKDLEHLSLYAGSRTKNV